MLKQNLAGRDGNIADVHVHDKGATGLVVDTRQFYDYTSRTRDFFDGDGNSEMALPSSYGLSPEKVHDGIDNVYWTATSNKGVWDFSNTGSITDHTPSDTGDHCIDGTASGKDGELDLTHPTSLDLNEFVAISGWIYITAWKVGSHIEFKGRLSGADISPKINIDGYFDPSLHNVWQQFQIPLEDIPLEGLTIDVIRIKNKNADNQFYFDDIQIEQIGTAFRNFQLLPDEDSPLHITTLILTFVAALDLDNPDGTVPAISYNDLLGVTLLSGFLYQRVQGGVVVGTQIIRSYQDLLISGMQSVHLTCDGVNTMLVISFDFPVPEVLKHTDNDSLRVQIQDENMDDFISVRMSISGYRLIN